MRIPTKTSIVQIVAIMSAIFLCKNGVSVEYTTVISGSEVTIPWQIWHKRNQQYVAHAGTLILDVENVSSGNRTEVLNSQQTSNAGMPHKSGQGTWNAYMNEFPLGSYSAHLSWASAIDLRSNITVSKRELWGFVATEPDNATNLWIARNLAPDGIHIEPKSIYEWVSGGNGADSWSWDNATTCWSDPSGLLSTADVTPSVDFVGIATVQAHAKFGSETRFTNYEDFEFVKEVVLDDPQPELTDEIIDSSIIMQVANQSTGATITESIQCQVTKRWSLSETATATATIGETSGFNKDLRGFAEWEYPTTNWGKFKVNAGGGLQWTSSQLQQLAQGVSYTGTEDLTESRVITRSVSVPPGNAVRVYLDCWARTRDVPCTVNVDEDPRDGAVEQSDDRNPKMVKFKPPLATRVANWPQGLQQP